MFDNTICSLSFYTLDNRGKKTSLKIHKKISSCIDRTVQEWQKYRRRYTIKQRNYRTPHTIVLWERRMGKNSFPDFTLFPSPTHTQFGWGRKQEFYVSFNFALKHTLSNCKWVTPSDETQIWSSSTSHTEEISQQAPTGNSGVGVESWEPDTTMFLSLKSQTSSKPSPRSLVHS